MSRLDDLRTFYGLLDKLERNLGGRLTLAHCDGRMAWPKRGVYFFFETDEQRSESGNGPRVVRVGTHALTATSKTTLWHRLSQHRGNASGSGGNHRGSIFRLLVGNAIHRRDHIEGLGSWGVGADPGAAARRFDTSRESILASEATLEKTVSTLIGAMPFVWLKVDNPSNSESLRGYIERNSIALLSNYGKPALDGPSSHWLGAHCDRERVTRSGLWNNMHVAEPYEPRFLTVLNRLI